MKAPIKSPSGLSEAEEAARLEEIASLNLITSKANPVLQSIVDAAAREMNLPMAVVSILLDDVQYFPAMSGVVGPVKEAKGTPIEWSFGINVVRTRKPFIVEEASTHPTMKDSPLVLVEGVRCYAGVPLVSSKGNALGSFSVLGREARQFTEAEIARLEEFGRRIIIDFEKRDASE